MNQIVVPTDVRIAMDVARSNHWQFRVWGTGPVPTEPIYTDSWWLLPAGAAEIPESGQERIAALKRAGIPIKAAVVGHEAPKALLAPKEQPGAESGSRQTAQSITSSGGGFILEGLLMLFGLTVQAMLVDPALVVILEDGTWLEVMTWLE